MLQKVGCFFSHYHKLFQPVLKRVNACTVISSSEHIFTKRMHVMFVDFKGKRAKDCSYQVTAGAKAKKIKEQAKKD